MKQTSLDALNASMFEAIEMLKSQNDPNASENEKIDVKTAEAIAKLGKNVVDAYKVKAQVLKTVAKSDQFLNPDIKTLTEGIRSNEQES